MPFGICTLQADDGLLTMTVESETADIPRLEKVIGDHLARFAFRENPSLVWKQGA